MHQCFSLHASFSKSLVQASPPHMPACGRLAAAALQHSCWPCRLSCLQPCHHCRRCRSSLLPCLLRLARLLLLRLLRGCQILLLHLAQPPHHPVIHNLKHLRQEAMRKGGALSEHGITRKRGGAAGGRLGGTSSWQHGCRAARHTEETCAQTAQKQLLQRSTHGYRHRPPHLWTAVSAAAREAHIYAQHAALAGAGDAALLDGVAHHLGVGGWFGGWDGRQVSGG